MSRQSLKSLLLAVLCALSASSIALGSPTALASEDPRYVAGKLKSVTFGDNATVTIESAKGIPSTFRVASDSKINVSNTSATLTDLYQKRLNQSIKIFAQKTSDGDNLKAAWDSASWTTYLNLHKGVQTGKPTGMYVTMTVLTDKAYISSVNTDYIRNGENGGRSSFGMLNQVWIKGDISSGYPVAKIIADKFEVANGGDYRPASGQTKRPRSTGTGNEPQYLIEVSFRINSVLDSDDNLRSATGAILTGDDKLECFGELQLNDVLGWWVMENQAHEKKIAKGKHYKIAPRKGAYNEHGGRFVIKVPTLRLKGVFKDWDKYGDSDLLMNVDTTLSLPDVVGKGPQYYRSTSGEVTLVVTVTLR